MNGLGDGYQKTWLRGRAYRTHRLVAVDALGRSLRAGEVVHHRDGDKTNNSPSNLLVLPSQSAHMMLEHQMRKAARGYASLFAPEEIVAKIEVEPRPVIKRKWLRRKSVQLEQFGLFE